MQNILNGIKCHLSAKKFAFQTYPPRGEGVKGSSLDGKEGVTLDPMVLKTNC